jgi:outer membrane protein assembly factor BamA
MKRLALYLLIIGAFAPILSDAQESDNEEPLIVENINCRGNQSTDCSHLIHRLSVTAGDPVDEEKLKNDQLRLETLPNFKSVRVFLEKGSEKGKANVVIEVVEANHVHGELTSGTTIWNSYANQSLGVRLTDDNLFQSGKILDFSFDQKFELNGPKRRHSAARLQYVDPSLFGQKKYFLVAGTTYHHFEIEYDEHDIGAGFRYQSRARMTELGADLSLGYRFGDYSYLSLGYLLNPISDWTVTESIRLDQTGQSEPNSFDTQYHFHYGYLLNYGWNSEDDPHFATTGSRFAANLLLDPKDDFTNLSLSYRLNWTGEGKSVWTFFAGNPGGSYDSSLTSAYGRTLNDMFMGLTYSKDLHQDVGHRSRLYASAGFASPSSEGQPFSQPALKTGWKFELNDWGYADLNLSFSQDVGRR